MRGAVALRLLGNPGDSALDRDDALGEAPAALRARQILDADAVGPVADEVEREQRRDQDQDGAARHRVGEAPLEEACHAGWPSSIRTDAVNR